MRRALALLCSVALLSCGDPPCDPNEPECAAPINAVTVGPEGGQVRVTGALLEVPAGALAKPREIRIVQTDDPTPEGMTAYTPRYRFEPAGLRFLVPVTVTFDAPAASPRATVFWSKKDRIGFDALPTTATAAGFSAKTDHFSLGFVGDGEKCPTCGDLPDSGTDAGTPDGGTDAGVTDAGALDAGITDAGITDAGLSTLNCAAFLIAGDPRADAGATWTYVSNDDAVDYALQGRLYYPQDGGAEPWPAVIISHGKGGMPGNPPQTPATFRSFGLAVIATRYTHAADDDGGLPAGGEGSSLANIQRAKKARDLLACLPVQIDFGRLAAHGHSKGAFVTGGLLGAHPSAFRAASYTAGGVTPSGDGTPPTLAEQIRTPFQLHHSVADCTVLYSRSEAMRDHLADSGVPHELHSYFYDAGTPGCPTQPDPDAGPEHALMQTDPVMYDRVRGWYQQHGVIP